MTTECSTHMTYFMSWTSCCPYTLSETSKFEQPLAVSVLDFETLTTLNTFIPFLFSSRVFVEVNATIGYPIV